MSCVMKDEIKFRQQVRSLGQVLGKGHRHMFRKLLLYTTSGVGGQETEHTRSVWFPGSVCRATIPLASLRRLAASESPCPGPRGAGDFQLSLHSLGRTGEWCDRVQCVTRADLESWRGTQPCWAGGHRVAPGEPPCLSEARPLFQKRQVSVRHRAP